MGICQLMLGDCLDVLKTMEEGSVGAFVCDPPYGIAFMGRKWDSDLEQSWYEDWLSECYRILPVGGLIIAASGTKTYHRIASAMETVGFVLDPGKCLESWVYASGMPKTYNVCKAVEKVLGEDEARRFKGYNLGLKPAWEPFLVGRKLK